MIEKEFDSVDALLSYFLMLLESKKQGVEKENKENSVKVNYESSQEDLIKRDTVTVDRQQVIEGLFQ